MVFSKDINALAHQEAILKRRFICACASVPALVAMYALVKSCLRGGLSLKKLAVTDLKLLNHPSTYFILGSFFLKSYFLTKLDGVIQKNLLKKICSNYEQHLEKLEEFKDLRCLNQAIDDYEDSREILLYLIKNKDLYFSIFKKFVPGVLNLEEFNQLRELSSLVCQKLPHLDNVVLDNVVVPSKRLYQLEVEGLFAILGNKLQFPGILFVNRAKVIHDKHGDEVAF